MDFRDVFIDSLSYPFTNVKRLLTLLILLLGSFILIPGIIACGYALRIIESTLNGEKELPNFDNLSDLLNKGIKYMGVNIIYKIPPLVITILIITQCSSLFGLNPDTSNTFFKYIAILVAFLFNIFLTIGVANMVYEKRFTAAFAFGKILDIIYNIGWKKYLSFLIVVTIISQIISNISLLFYQFIPNTIISSPISHLVISFILLTYILPFTNRFRGLIYPVDENKMEIKEA